MEELDIGAFPAVDAGFREIEALVLKGPVLRTACGPETGLKQTGLSVLVLVLFFENQGPIKKPVLTNRFL